MGDDGAIRLSHFVEEDAAAEAAYWAARAVALGNSGAAKVAAQLRGRLSAPQQSDLDRRLSEAAKAFSPAPVTP